ncbi:MAG: tape measure protein [Lacrimispora saccharolytica]
MSQQATQMAAKPTIAWEDFKLMVEQTPAGIAAVAKQMGMSTQEMIRNVQDGQIATEDFFNAIAEVGTNDAFTKLATEYKTVDQAMSGLKETLSN